MDSSSNSSHPRQQPTPNQLYNHNQLQNGLPNPMNYQPQFPLHHSTSSHNSQSLPSLSHHFNQHLPPINNSYSQQQQQSQNQSQSQRSPVGGGGPPNQSVFSLPHPVQNPLSNYLNAPYNHPQQPMGIQSQPPTQYQPYPYPPPPQNPIQNPMQNHYQPFQSYPPPVGYPMHYTPYQQYRPPPPLHLPHPHPGAGGNHGNSQDPSASAAAAALVGLPSAPSGIHQPGVLPPQNYSVQHGGQHGPGGGGGMMDSLGLPIPPAHYLQPQQPRPPSTSSKPTPLLPPQPNRLAPPGPPPSSIPGISQLHSHPHPQTYQPPSLPLQSQFPVNPLPNPLPIPSASAPAPKPPPKQSKPKPRSPSPVPERKQSSRAAKAKKQSYAPIYDSDFDFDDDSDDGDGNGGGANSEGNSDGYQQEEEEEEEINQIQGRVEPETELREIERGQGCEEEVEQIQRVEPVKRGRPRGSTNKKKAEGEKARKEKKEKPVRGGKGKGKEKEVVEMDRDELVLPDPPRYDDEEQSRMSEDLRGNVNGGRGIESQIGGVPGPSSLVKGEDILPPSSLSAGAAPPPPKKNTRGGWGGTGGEGSGTRPETFLRKLWKMLHNDPVDMSEFIRWDKSGRLLLIPNEEDLVEKVCKVHFSQKSITSFNKQMNNWEFRRHSRSQRDLAHIAKSNPGVSRSTRIWYHTSLHSRSTWADVADVVRHEDGMAKKRRVRSKKTGVEEEPATRKGRPKGSGGPLRLPGIGPSSDEESVEEVEEGWETKKRGTKSRGVVGKKETKATSGKRTRGPTKAKGKGKGKGKAKKEEESESESEEDEFGGEEEEEEEEDRPSRAKRQKLTRSTTPQQRKNTKGKGKANDLDELPEPPTRSSKAQLVANATSSNPPPPPPPNYPPQPYPQYYDLVLPQPPRTVPYSDHPPLASTSNQFNAVDAPEESRDGAHSVHSRQEASTVPIEVPYDDEQDAEGEIDAEGVDDDDVEMNDVTSQPQASGSRDEEMRDVIDEDEQLATQADEATNGSLSKTTRGFPKKKNVTAAKKKAAARKPAPAAPRPTSNEPTPPPNDNDDSSPAAPSTGGRRTRASLAAADPSLSRSAPSTKLAKGGKGAKGKKGGAVPANAGLVSPGEATPEKQAIQGQPEEKVAQDGEKMHLDELKAAEIAAGGDGVGESEETRTQQVRESIEIVRQEAPKLKSRGGGWYHPARAAEDAKKKQEAEDQQKASEEMRRGGVGITPGTPSSAVYALPRPPHLSNLLDDDEPASSTPAEPGRASSHPADFYPPQPKTAQYGSSPYPSTQAPVARTPQAIHHPQDAPNPYFSDPGYERAPYYEVGTEPAPRPYIHPAHAVPEEFFVPGATVGQSRQGQEQETSPYPVPRAEEVEESKEEEIKEDEKTVSKEVENGGQPSDAANPPEDYDAQFAELEALVADEEGEPHLDRGSGIEDEEDIYAQREVKAGENGAEVSLSQEVGSAAVAQ